jgi:adenosylcobinamide amidohydrolase
MRPLPESLVPSRNLGHESMAIVCSGRWLVASFNAPVRACSWAIVGGGFAEVLNVAWREVRDEDLCPPIDPRAFLKDRLRECGLAQTVGLLTSRSVATFSDTQLDAHGVRARCIATVGLGNALRSGDPAGIAGRIGTINLLVHLDTPLTQEALLEASAIATEAKTAVVLEAGIVSRQSGRPATGTGTDCTVITCKKGIAAAMYAGKHTTLGSLVGATVERAVKEGTTQWLAERTRE